VALEPGSSIAGNADPINYQLNAGDHSLAISTETVAACLAVNWHGSVPLSLVCRILVVVADTISSLH
jgi:hypothetical protein